MRIDYLFDLLVAGGAVCTQSPAAGQQNSTSPTTVPGGVQNAATGASGGPTFFGNNVGSTAPPSAGGNGNPLISQDMTGFSQYSIGQIQGNPVIIGNLPGVTQSGPTTIGSALQEFMDLPPPELQALEMQLWDAGYYVDGAGQPISAQDIRFGVPGDPSSWTAFARALGAASASGTPLTQLLQQRAGMGAGINKALPSPVTGGGHAYTIDLSNPATVKLAADQIFQAALGRNANAQEVSDITSKLRSQETQQGLTQQQGAEQQSRAVYQTEVNQRNVAYENQVNPNLGGRVPTGPFQNPEQWATALLSYMNLPVTTSNVAALSSWVQKTGKFSDGNFNPLATERPEGGSQSGAGGVQQFQNWAQGLEGTASMLLNGKYQGLISALQNGNAADAVRSDKNVQRELSSWSGGKISSLTVDSNTTQQSALASFYWNNSQQGQAQQPGQGQLDATGMPLGELAGLAKAQDLNPPLTGQAAVDATMQAANSNPAVANYLQAVNAQQQQQQQAGTISPSDVTEGQQPPNPGDAYINPVTVFDINPASEQAQAYQEATTGANRIPYAGNTFLRAYDAVLGMIKNGGPTG